MVLGGGVLGGGASVAVRPRAEPWGRALGHLLGCARLRLRFCRGALRAIGDRKDQLLAIGPFDL